MGKDQSKDKYIGADGEYLYVCEICKSAGKEKYWYTRQISRDRHLGTHRPEARGFRCPGTDCGHQVQEARLPDLRVHVASVHRGEDVPRGWDQKEPVMLRLEVAGPSQEEGGHRALPRYTLLYSSLYPLSHNHTRI